MSGKGERVGGPDEVERQVADVRAVYADFSKFQLLRCSGGGRNDLFFVLKVSESKVLIRIFSKNQI